MNIHSQKRRGFTRFGAGTFTCQVCKRRTREMNGDHAQTGNCHICFELAGIENSISDEGDEAIERYYDEARGWLQKLSDMGVSTICWMDLIYKLDEWNNERSAK